MSINWEKQREYYNKTYNTKYKNTKNMLEDLCLKIGREELSERLSISRETIRRKMHSLGIKMQNKGRPRLDTSKKGIFQRIWERIF